MDRSTGIGLLILAGIAAWAYSQSVAGSSAPVDTGSGGGTGYGGADPFASLFNSGSGATPSTDTVSSGTTSFLDLLGLGSASTDTGLSTTTSGSTIDMTNAYWKTASYPQYAVLIANTEDRNGIPRDLLARLLYQESAYQPAIIDGTERSSVGAEGIAQFMPATAAWLGIDPLDPTQAIPAAGKLLASYYAQFGDWSDALMAYNWGPGNVSKWLASGQSTPVPQETQNYVASITADVSVA